MKMKSFAMLALLAASFAYIAPALADDSLDTVSNTNQSMQTPTIADNSSMQNNNGTQNSSDNNSQSSDNNSNSNDTSNNSSNDEGNSPDTATGDDDY